MYPHMTVTYRVKIHWCLSMAGLHGISYLCLFSPSTQFSFPALLYFAKLWTKSILYSLNNIGNTYTEGLLTPGIYVSAREDGGHQGNSSFNNSLTNTCMDSQRLNQHTQGLPTWVYNRWSPRAEGMWPYSNQNAFSYS